MKIILVGGHNNGRILDIPSNRVGYPIVLPIKTKDNLLVGEWKEQEHYIVETLRVE